MNSLLQLLRREEVLHLATALDKSTTVIRVVQRLAVEFMELYDATGDPIGLERQRFSHHAADEEIR